MSTTLPHPLRFLAALLLLLSACSGVPPQDAAPVVAPAAAQAPLASRTMDEATARAMLARFGYGATPASLQRAEQQTLDDFVQNAVTGSSHLPDSVQQAIDALPASKPATRIWKLYGWYGSELVDTGKHPSPEDRVAYLDWLRGINRLHLNAAIQARLLAMANSDNPGHESLLAFWLNHFSIYGPKKELSLLAADYAKALDDALREDSFPALLRASFYHPAMQIYLDNVYSTGTNSHTARKARDHHDDTRYGINENLARELLELHTLGVDAGYSQRDVQQLARIISGAGVYAGNMTYHILKAHNVTRKELFVFEPNRHDYGEKILLNYTFPASVGLPEIDRALDILALHPATAHHLAQKLAERYLADNPPPEVVDAMAAAYLASGGKLTATLRALVHTQAFADSLVHPQKFKEPLDYLLSTARTVCGDTPINNGFFLAATAYSLGEAPFYHASPDGYGTAETDWLSPPAMAKRLRLAMNLSARYPPFAALQNPSMPHLSTIYEHNPQELRAGLACTLDRARMMQVTGLPAPADSARVAAFDDIDAMRFILASRDFQYR